MGSRSSATAQHGTVRAVPAETLRLITDDGVELDADLDLLDAPVAVAAVLHPHPLYGGDRRSPVVQGVRRSLVEAGVAVLTLDFRGVGSSGGTHGGGVDERRDAASAVEFLASRFPARPLVLAGYSFGSLVALGTRAEAIDAWVAIAPPLTAGSDPDAATDARPKLVVAARHDQFCPATAAAVRTSSWTNCEFAELPTADHFLAGSIAATGELVAGFVRRVAGR